MEFNKSLFLAFTLNFALNGSHFPKYWEESFLPVIYFVCGFLRLQTVNVQFFNDSPPDQHFTMLVARTSRSAFLFLLKSFCVKSRRKRYERLFNGKRQEKGKRKI